MKQNPLILPIVGGGIALLCFFMPWIKIDMSSLGLDPAFSNLQGTTTIFGIQFVIGGSTFEILTFLAALVILGVCFYMLTQKTLWNSRIPVLICSGFGFLYVSIALIRFIIQYNLMASKMWERMPPEADIGKFASLQFGIIGVVIGFFIAFYGAWNMPKTDTLMEENENRL